jgi:hypothetical protein
MTSGRASDPAIVFGNFSESFLAISIVFVLFIACFLLFFDWPVLGNFSVFFLHCFYWICLMEAVSGSRPMIKNSVLQAVESPPTVADTITNIYYQRSAVFMREAIFAKTLLLSTIHRNVLIPVFPKAMHGPEKPSY